MNEQNQKMIERATEVLRLAQQDARRLAAETGTPFIAEGWQEKRSKTYAVSSVQTAVVKEVPSSKETDGSK